MIVPALVLTLGFAMPEAVGTSLVVIAINAAVALAMRAGSSHIDWSAALPFLVTVHLDPRAPASAPTLSRALAEAGLDASVDDHSLWRTGVERSDTQRVLDGDLDEFVEASLKAGLEVGARRAS